LFHALAFGSKYSNTKQLLARFATLVMAESYSLLSRRVTQS
jgi:hypothetical protein